MFKFDNLELTIDYTLSRYLDVSDEIPYEQYTKDIAVEKLEIAKEVLKYFNKRWGELLKINGLIDLSKKLCRKS